MKKTTNNSILLILIFWFCLVWLSAPSLHAEAPMPKVKAQFACGKSEKEAWNNKPGNIITVGANEEIYCGLKMDTDFADFANLKRADYMMLFVDAVNLGKQVGIITLKKDFINFYRNGKEVLFDIIPGKDHYYQALNEAKKSGKDPKNWQKQQDAINRSKASIFPSNFMEKLAKLPVGTHSIQVVLKRNAFDNEPYSAGIRFNLEITSASSGRFSSLAKDLKKEKSNFSVMQPSVDYSKIKTTTVLTSNPHIEQGGKLLASVQIYPGNVLFYKGKEMGKFSGDSLYSGIHYRGKKFMSKYTPYKAKTIAVTEKGFRQKFTVTYGGRTVASLVSVGKKDLTIDPQHGTYTYTLFRKNKKWAVVKFIPENDSAEIIMKLMVVLYHNTGFFR